VARSPLLPGPQRGLCLSCHGSRADLDRMVREGSVSATARPALLGTVLALPFQHPVSAAAFSEHESGSVTCTSCHSPHRGSRDPAGQAAVGRKRLSPKNDGGFEFELCEECHGNKGSTTRSLADVSRLLSPDNRSYHPVEAPAREPSASVIAALRGREINCTDCHGNADTRGPLGPHGSTEAYLLRARHTTVDGLTETAANYELCYSCHSREAVLRSTVFPEHRQHIVELRSACATCHNAHGSVVNRALIRFGEETLIGGVSPSVQTGRIAFLSNGPGEGTCHLTCHGKDHGPLSYGGLGPVRRFGGQP
jgi:hypothetical protein